MDRKQDAEAPQGRRLSVRTIFVFVLVLLVCASRLPATLLGLAGITRPGWLSAVQGAVMLLVLAASIPLRVLSPLRRLSGALSAIILLQEGGRILSSQPFWRNLFALNTLAGSLGSGITLKALSALCMVAFLLLSLHSAQKAYLVPGDLTVKARSIPWLGIAGDRIPWGKLSVISAVLISLGTILLTVVTVTGFRLPSGWKEWVSSIPLLLLFAAINAISEGILYRNGILGPLQGILSDHRAAIGAAVLFGLAHYEGAPGGPLGVVMSGLLGWYMCRSMVETKGFSAAWIIHFMQDFVIFSSLFLLSGQLTG